MAFGFQVTVDSAHPHRQADWWAETLGWEVEPSDEDFIRQMIAAGQATEADTTTHRGHLVWKEGAAIRFPGGEGPANRVLFQLVPEKKVGKNRLHLDIRVGKDHVEEQVGQLIARGATRLWDGHQGPYNWVTMADPEGNEFCVT